MLRRLFLFALLLPLLAFGQSLTSAQLTTLKAAIAAETDPVLVTAREAGATGAMAAFYNTASNPAFIVWRTNVTNDELGDAMNGTEVAGLSSLNMQRLQVLAAYSGGSQNMSRSDRRAAFDAVFSGAGGATTRAAMAALWKRIATRAERLYATGTGTTAIPGLMTYEGQVSDANVIAAINLP